MRVGKAWQYGVFGGRVSRVSEGGVWRRRGPGSGRLQYESGEVVWNNVVVTVRDWSDGRLHHECVLYCMRSCDQRFVGGWGGCFGWGVCGFAAGRI